MARHGNLTTIDHDSQVIFVIIQPRDDVPVVGSRRKKLPRLLQPQQLKQNQTSLERAAEGETPSSKFTSSHSSNTLSTGALLLIWLFSRANEPSWSKYAAQVKR